MITAFTCGGIKAIDCIKGLYALDCMGVFGLGEKGANDIMQRRLVTNSN